MRLSQAPWLIVSVLIHLGVLALAFLAPAPAKQANLFASAMPVTIVSELPMAAPVLAPEPQPDAAPPVEEAVDTPEPPQPTPPAKAAPPPAPNPTKPVRPTPPPPPKKGPPGKPFSLDDFISDKPAKPAKKASSPGNPRPAAAPNLGAPAFDPSQLGGFQAKVTRLWQLNCEIGDTRTAVVEVSVVVLSNGTLRDNPPPRVLNPSKSPAALGAQRQAVIAIQRAAPFTVQEVPPSARNVEIQLEFHAADVCRKRGF